ncbi:hypothetical protein ACFVTX_18175 [Agromyces sp. NPDC058136]|uniref:hypothetical protein n=1 Tax=Agromyces sp. NPDC058136 TaxID=3346354 RepID=UPI0036DCEB20
MDFKKMLEARAAARAALVAKRAALGEEASAIVATAEADSARGLTDVEDARSLEIIGQRASLATEISALDTQIEEIRAAEAADVEERSAAARGTATGVDRTEVRVVAEPRTYMRENDPKGKQFARDVALQFLRNDTMSNDRLRRHMDEERVERERAGTPLIERAAGTGNFSGLVVPQYLTDLYAPKARAGRPFADACRHHDLPETGMTAYIGKVTTGTSADDQAAEHAAVSETDIDDTLLSVPIATAAGSQTLSRQGVERGIGVEDTTVEDLFSAYATNLDGKLLNKATIGLTNVATPLTYTSGAPTAIELYPKLIGASAAVEAALLTAMLGDTIVVMHSRRWYWLQAQLSNQWPLFGQPGVAAQHVGENYGERYGAGFRGVLPNGTPVIVDNNIATNLGAGTNQDEIYSGAQSELHLWEDPNAPMFIRAEQVKKLDIDLVVYGYYAFTAERRPHAQKISGTGLIAPTF